MSDTIVSVRPYIIGATRTDFVVPAAGGKVLLGDAGITADRYFGLRAYSTAAIGLNAIRLRRDSDTSETDIVTVAGGGLDYTAINAFDTGGTLRLRNYYNQTPSGTGEVMSAPAATAAVFNKNGGGANIPTVTVANAVGESWQDTTTFPTSIVPFALAAYVNHTSGGGGSIMGDNSVNFVDLVHGDTSISVFQNNDFVTGYTLSSGVSSGVWNAVLGLFGGAGTSAINFNGSDSTGSSGGTNALTSSQFGLNGGPGFGTFFTGQMSEFAIFLSGNAPNAAQRSTITNNMRNWWGL